MPASRYGVRIQGADVLALTKLDVLSCLERIPVCTAYEVEGRRTERFPTGAELDAARPILEYLPGWRCDLTGCRKPSDLPQSALDYVAYLERAVDCRIRYVSVGAERDACIRMD